MKQNKTILYIPWVRQMTMMRSCVLGECLPMAGDAANELKAGLGSSDTVHFLSASGTCPIQ